MTYSALDERDTDRRPGGYGHPFRVIRLLRHTLVALLIVGAATAAFAAGTAGAAGAVAKSKTPCWKVLINDWYDGRIDGIYAIHCYRDALQHLPADVDTYSSAQGRHPAGAAEADHPGPQRRRRQRRTGERRGCRRRRHERWRQRRRRNLRRRDVGRRHVGRQRHQRPDPERDQQARAPRRPTPLPVPLLVLGGVALLLMAAGGSRFPDAPHAHAAGPARFRRLGPARPRAGADRAVVAAVNRLQIS